MAMGNDGCNWVTARLPLQAGGELFAQDRRRVERHLLTCSTCRDRLASLQRAVDLLRNTGAVPTPFNTSSPSVWPMVAQQIRESRHVLSQNQGWTFPRPFWPIRLAMAASVLGLITAVGFSLHQVQQENELVFSPWPPTLAFRPKLAIDPPVLLPSHDLPDSVAEIEDALTQNDESAETLRDDEHDLIPTDEPELGDSEAPVGTSN